MHTQKIAHADNCVSVHGRSYLAGSDHSSVPSTIPNGRGTLARLEYALTDKELSQRFAQIRKDVDQELAKTGAVLVCADWIKAPDDFSNFVDGLGYEKGSFKGGIAVRDHKSKKAVIASQEDKCITLAPHNEMSYLPKFPNKIFFFCEIAAPKGGEVPINDIRLTKKLIPQELLEKFRKHGIRYTRHLPAETKGAHLSWSDTFGSVNKAEIEDFMTENSFDFDWDENGNLTYSYVNPAFISHPDTGEELWFNQVTELHSSYWRNHPEFAPDLPETGYPATTSFGNGDPIELDTIHMLRGLLWQTASAIKMRPGEILILDNRVMQHGRFSFEGQRKHFVKMTA